MRPELSAKCYTALPGKHHRFRLFFLRAPVQTHKHSRAEHFSPEQVGKHPSSKAKLKTITLWYSLCAALGAAGKPGEGAAPLWLSGLHSTIRSRSRCPVLGRLLLGACLASSPAVLLLLLIIAVGLSLAASGTGLRLEIPVLPRYGCMMTLIMDSGSSQGVRILRSMHEDKPDVINPFSYQLPSHLSLFREKGATVTVACSPFDVYACTSFFPAGLASAGSASESVSYLPKSRRALSSARFCKNEYTALAQVSSSMGWNMGSSAVRQ